MTAQVFLSYGREDKGVAHRVAERLDQLGYSVWWDPEIKAGAAYSRSISRALNEADCVIVLWSARSIDSDWVHAEADKGWKRGILVPAIIEDVEPPIPFGQLETLDLVAWAHALDEVAFQRLQGAVAAHSRPLGPVARWVQAATAEGETEAMPLEPQPSWVSSVAFADTGTALTAGGDGVLRSWSLPGGEAAATASGHKGPIWCCAAGAGVVATGGSDSTVRLWQAETLAPSRVIEGHRGWVLGCALSPGGATLASSSRDETVRLWDVSTGEAQATLTGHLGAVWDCTFSPDGRLLASTSDDQTVRVWSTRERAAVYVLRGHGAPVMATAFLPDGETLLSGGYDGTARAWNMKTGTESFRLGAGDDWILSLAVAPGGSVALAGTKSGTIQVWDLVSHEMLAALAVHAGPVLAIDLSVTFGLLSGSADSTASVLRRRPVRLSK